MQLSALSVPDILYSLSEIRFPVRCEGRILYACMNNIFTWKMDLYDWLSFIHYHSHESPLGLLSYEGVVSRRMKIWNSYSSWEFECFMRFFKRWVSKFLIRILWSPNSYWRINNYDKKNQVPKPSNIFLIYSLCRNQGSLSINKLIMLDIC